MTHIRYAAAACQTDLANPADRAGMRANTDRMLSMIDSAVAGSAPFLPVRLVVFPEFAHAAPVYATVAELREHLAVPDPERAHRSPRAQGARAPDLHPERDDDRGRSAVAGRRLQHDVPHRTRGPALQVPEGQSLDSVRGACEPARSRGLRRAALPRRRHADRADRLRDLLRLAVSGGDAPAGRERRRGARARVGLHGSVGRDRADELVDARQPLPRAREHRLRRRRQPGRQPAALPAVLLARRQPGRGLRRPAARRSLARPRRAHRRGADRHQRAAPRTRDAARPSHARAPADRGLPGLWHARLSARHAHERAEPLSYERNVELIDEARARLEAATPFVSPER